VHHSMERSCCKLIFPQSTKGGCSDLGRKTTEQRYGSLHFDTAPSVSQSTKKKKKKILKQPSDFKGFGILCGARGKDSGTAFASDRARQEQLPGTTVPQMSSTINWKSSSVCIGQVSVALNALSGLTMLVGSSCETLP